MQVTEPGRPKNRDPYEENYAVPEEPFGGRYLYEPATGKVVSSTLRDRLILHEKKSGQ